ncbi:glutathione S-transferase family protein [Marinobacter sp. M3C]|uniref:glutathione S-transferase family protein n=1 Tax=Marinobacter sp. M3C TaxID=2917715 RepID=UPI00200BD371|nr:glutathione S-transferase family protein [Marinobacter sp. M3C]UQG58653.1 glutathione S-transferase family protein [Marinobacter sp. M3C]
MDLIGTLDSPYVRRVAISLEYYGIRYRHKPISVFDSFDEFAKINPVVKAPTIVLDDGGVLLDSSLILDYFERQNHTGRRLMPDEPLKQARAVRTIGLALAACEKAIQIIYERKMRPLDKQYKPWVDRITAQLLAAFRELDYEIDSSKPSTDCSIEQAGITVAVAWSFSQRMLGDIVVEKQFQNINAYVRAIEKLHVFQTIPLCSTHNIERAKRKEARFRQALFRS